MPITPIPRTAGNYVPRPRLSAALDAGFQITIVRGPTGSGKTSLVAEWVRASGRPTVWVEGNDVSRRSFWLAVLEQAESLVEGQSHMPLQNVSASPVLDVDALVDRLAALPFLLIIDDYDTAADDVLSRDLIRFVEQSPNASLVILTRAGTQLEETVVSRAMDATVICHTELALTEPEQEALLASLIRVPMPRGTAVPRAQLPLTVRVMALLVNQNGWSSIDTPELRVRLGTAVLQRLTRDALDPDLRDFLLVISEARYVTVDLARRLAPGSDVDAHLEAAEAAGLGNWRSVSGTARFTLVPEVRAGLREALAEHAGADVSRILREVAVWSMHNHEPTQAVRAAIALGDYDLVSAAMLQSFGEIYTRTSLEIGAVLDTANKAEIRKRPLLSLMLAGWLHATNQRLRAVSYLEAAVRRARASAQDPRDEHVAQLAIESTALRLLGRTSGSAKRARELVAATQVPSLAQWEGSADVLPLAVNHAAISLLHAGDPQVDAATELSMAVAMPRRPDHWFHAASIRAGAFALAGEMTAAEQLLRTIDASKPHPDRYSSYQGYLGQVARALVAVEANDLDSASEELDRATSHNPRIEHWAYGLYAETLIRLVSGHREDAITLLRAELGANRKLSVPALRHLQLLGVSALSGAGRQPAADSMLGRPSKGDTTGLLLLGVRNLFVGREELAVGQLGPIGTSSDPGLSVRTRIIANLGYAIAVHRLEQGSDMASEAVLRAVSLMELNGISFAPLIVLPPAGLVVLRDHAPGDSLRHPIDVILSRIGGSLEPEAPPTPLSRSEQRVLEELRHTESAAEIAAILSVSINTVKSQLRTSYRKLGARSRKEALAQASRRGLFTSDGKPS